MAEFIEVARAKRRMCKAHHIGECNECKIQGICTLLNVCAHSDDDVKKLENEVMSWAAEHPEPVYPTWLEWLESLGFGIAYRDGYDANGVEGWAFNFNEAEKPIPADLARKLGIKPKEK